MARKGQRVSATQGELELHRQEEERLKAELKRKEEALKAAEEARQRAEAQRKLPAMSDSDFMNLCKSGNITKIEEAIMNGAELNARNNKGWIALRWARDEKTRHLLRKYGATK